MLAQSSSEETDESFSNAAQPCGPDGRAGSARILILEDERHIARLLQFVLEKAGYDLTICHSAEQALPEIAKQTTDALVLDLVLPGMSGLDFLRTVRSAPYSCQCVVIVLTSHSLRATEAALLEAGATALCSKPIAPSSLLRKLEQLGVYGSASRES